MKKEDQFLKVEVRLADRILEQYKEEGFIVLQIENQYLPRILNLLKLEYIEKSQCNKYMAVPGEGIWPYSEDVQPSYFADGQFDPIPLIIGLEKIRSFLEKWDPDLDQDFNA